MLPKGKVYKNVFHKGVSVVALGFRKMWLVIDSSKVSSMTELLYNFCICNRYCV